MVLDAPLPLMKRLLVLLFRPLGRLLEWAGIMHMGGERSTGSIFLSDIYNAWHANPPEGVQPMLVPWERPAGTGRPDDPVLVLIHGHFWYDSIGEVPEPMNRAFLFANFREDARFTRLIERYRVYHFVYPTNRPHQESARDLATELAKVLPPADGRRDLTLIAHSMGGLVARRALQIDGLGDRTQDLFTLATPHRGTELASLVAATPRIRAKLGWFGYVCWALARRVWRPHPGMLGMAADNHDGKIPLDEVERFGVHINHELRELNEQDRYLDRVTCMMGRVENRVIPGRNVFDQIPRWYLGRTCSVLRYLDPLIVPQSGLAEGLPVRDRHLFEGLDHESVITSARPLDFLFHALMGPVADVAAEMETVGERLLTPPFRRAVGPA